MLSTYSISYQPFLCTFESGTLPGTQGMRGTQDRDLFSTCVSELVMESREFEMLLGKIQPDGSRKPGCIEKFQKDTSEVISFVAAEAEGKGLYEDADTQGHENGHNSILDYTRLSTAHFNPYRSAIPSASAWSRPLSD